MKNLRYQLSIFFGLFLFIMFYECEVAESPNISTAHLKRTDVSLLSNTLQNKILAIAYDEGNKIGYPETIQAIAMQETLAGLLGPVGDLSLPFGKRSYGVMQVKLATAHEVFKYYPDKFTVPNTQEELLVKLIADDRFNIKVGSYYFLHMMAKKKRWKYAVLAYNRGYLSGDPNNYPKKILFHIVKKVRPFNLRSQLAFFEG